MKRFQTTTHVCVPLNLLSTIRHKTPCMIHGPPTHDDKDTMAEYIRTTVLFYCYWKLTKIIIQHVFLFKFLDSKHK